KRQGCEVTPRNDSGKSCISRQGSTTNYKSMTICVRATPSVPPMPTWFTLENVLITTYLVILLTLALYGFHRSMLTWLYFRHYKPAQEPENRFPSDDLPRVTIQLPLFNEMYVAARLLDAVAKIDYARDRFEVQVLDDSTDETQEICRAKVAELVATGLDI